MQVHKRNQHSGRASNVGMNRAHKRRASVQATLTFAPHNRAERRTPKRLAHAEELRMRAEVAALVTAQSPDAIVNHGVAAA